MEYSFGSADSLYIALKVKSNQWVESMKLFIRVVLGVIILGFTAGCDWWDGLKQQPQRRETQGNLSAARGMVRDFYQARLDGDSEDAIKQYLSAEGFKDYTEKHNLNLIGSNNPFFTGFHIIKAEAVSPTDFRFNVALQSAYLGRAYADNTIETVNVRHSDNRYLINSAMLVERVAVTVNDNKLKLKSSLTGKPEKILSRLDQLPQELTPQGAGPDIRFGFGKEGYAAAAMSPDNRRVAFATRGIHGGIAWIENVGEQIIVTPLDILFEGLAGLLILNPEGKLLAVQYFSPTGNQALRIYNLDRRALIPTQIGAKFPPDRFSLALLNWESPSVLLFKVKSGAGAGPANEDQLGNWRLELESGRISQAIQ